MRSGAHARLSRLNRRLIRRIQRAEIQSLLGYCALDLTKLNMQGIVETGLHSPLKQIFHVLGLMLGTLPRRQTHEVSEEEWSDWKRMLNTIFWQYLHLFLPSGEESNQLTEELWKIRDVAMRVFVNHFNTRPLAYEEQLAERIDSWFGPFEEMIAAQTGFQVGRFLDMVRWIGSEQQRDFDLLHELKGKFKEETSDFRRQVVSHEWSPQSARTAAPHHPPARTAAALNKVLDRLFMLDRKRFEAAFSDTEVASFYDYFVACRGDYPGYFYPTEENPAELRPIFSLEDGRAFCPTPSALYHAALRRWYALLRSSAKADAFLRHRDEYLEARTRAVLGEFLGAENVWIWQNICETPDGQWEHDLLVDVDGTYLAVEAKATPPKEPFRDPEKAYTRIRSDFHGDAGIQKAYEQANRLRKLLLCKRETTLYDRDGNVALTFSGPVREVFCVCVTADSFGPLAVDLSLLLEKDPDEPYPWAVGIFDLETLLAGFSHMGKTRDDFLSYLRQRSNLHGLAVGTDELEVAGMFLRYGDFERYMTSDEARVILTPDLSDIFDEIYFDKLGVERRAPGEIGDRPFTIDLSQLMRETAGGERRKLGAAMAQRRKVGRNDPCPCGSEVKYKRCHGK